MNGSLNLSWQNSSSLFIYKKESASYVTLKNLKIEDIFSVHYKELSWEQGIKAISEFL